MNAPHRASSPLARQHSSAYRCVSKLSPLPWDRVFADRESFLRSFIKRVEVRDRKLTIDYTMPLQTRKVDPPYREVLPFVRTGSPDRTLLELPLRISRRRKRPEYKSLSGSSLSASSKR
jgi:hypothetical protein